MLMGEAATLVLVCVGYASAGTTAARLAEIDLGLCPVYACLVADQLLMAIGITRATYLHKIV
ncbi:MAG: hypothetical protein GX492_02995 [Firmicutes bacterium]|nr:hypothetical protein [Bacillota bacterium]